MPDEEASDVVTPRELAGMIRRANDCFLWVPYGNGEGLWVRVAHTTAHTIVEDAYEAECDAVFAYMSEGDLYIGDDIISELEGEDAPEGAPEAPAGDETETP
jgi:hypothetical protein